MIYVNREIKFRAWDNFQKRWLQWDELKNRNDINVWLSGQHVKQNECVVQFTGLHDKNGVEIYEGDLIKDGSKIFKIIFKHGCFGIYKKEKLSFHSKEIYEKFISIYNYFGTDIDCVVIGNIYENENLLK